MKELLFQLTAEVHWWASLTIQAEESFPLAAGAIRDWWNIYQLNQFNSNDSKTEENTKELGGKKLRKFFCRQLMVEYQSIVWFLLFFVETLLHKKNKNKH